MDLRSSFERHNTVCREKDDLSDQRTCVVLSDTFLVWTGRTGGRRKAEGGVTVLHDQTMAVRASLGLLI